MKNFYRLIQGDCIPVLKGMDENSIDCAVTDPPYGIAFMGKSWDKALPPKEAFSEMFRVLKPGALAFVMSSPRQDVLCRMMLMLEDVGFEMRQSPIFHAYASGFPKAYDVSKGIDRKIIREDFIKEFGRKPTREELNNLVKEKRKVIGKGKGTSLNYQNKINVKQGFRPSDYYEEKNGEFNITSSYSPLAKRWVGWKSQTGLKPAVEVILMVNKPRSERTIVDNVLKHGTGAMNVDETRIPYNGSEDSRTHKGWSEGQDSLGHNHNLYKGGFKEGYIPQSSPKGRFPANLLVSDDVLDTGKITKARSGFRKATKTNNYTIQFEHKSDEVRSDFQDSGGFSRFFSLDAWWRERIKKLPKDIQKTFPFLVVPKASKSERDKGLEKFPLKKQRYQDGRSRSHEIFEIEGSGRKTKTVNRNFHPTVKPLKLMSYLVTLGCPQGGVVLDPFLGSGTTMLASVLMNKSCIGIELNAEYCAIAKGRCFKK